jgi:arsenate reductase
MSQSFNSKSIESKQRKRYFVHALRMRTSVKWQRVYLVNTLQKNFEPVSTGTRHRSQIKPLAVEVMGQIGIDIGSQKPKEITGEMMRNATKIIYTGCMYKDFCHTVFPQSRGLWIEDPKDNPIDRVSEARDETEIRIKEILKEKDTQCITIATFMP